MSQGSLNLHSVRQKSPFTGFRPASTPDSSAFFPDYWFIGVHLDPGKFTTEIRSHLKQLKNFDESQFSSLRQLISLYKPLMVVVGLEQISNTAIDVFLSQFNGQLLMKILVVSSPMTHPDAVRKWANSRRTNPCDPIAQYDLPSDESQIVWEVENFVVQSKRFQDNMDRLTKMNSLSNRETRICNYVTLGYPNKKIASLLEVSEKTVEKSRREIYEKLNVGSGPELSNLVTLKNFYRWPKDLKFLRPSEH